jgi:hypothetical protein
VIFTVRAYDARSTKVVTDWLDYFGIPYDSVTNVKGNADLYVDNKAYTFTTWPELAKLVRAMWPNAKSQADSGPPPGPEAW